MSAQVQIVIALLGLLMAARTHITVTELGSPVVIPVLWLVAAAVVLALAALVLWIARMILRDGLRLRPVAVSP